MKNQIGNTAHFLSSFITISNTSFAEPSHSCEWDHDTEMLQDEELSGATSSNEEAIKVLELWKVDQDQDLEMMEIDEQIDANLLEDDIFGPSCVSSTDPLEDLVLVNILDEDDDHFFAPFSDSADDTTPPSCTSTSSFPLEERHQMILKKLQESMKRSQETRKSLSTMKTYKMEQYPRIKSVNGVLSSIEMSSHQLQDYYIKSIQRQM
jgi:hypothetical protein